MHFDESNDSSTLRGAAASLTAVSEVLSAESSSSQTDESDDSLEEEIVTLPTGNNDDSNSQPMILPPGGLFSILQSILSFPYNMGIKTLGGIYYILSKIFPFLPRLTGLSPASSSSASHSLSRSAKNGIVTSFEKIYGKTGLRFFKGEFPQALDRAKSQFKYLIVVIQGHESDLDCPFNRQVLTDSRVVEFLTSLSEKVILWMGDAATLEGSQVARKLSCARFPCVQLNASTPRSLNSFAVTLKTLTTIYGEKDPIQFITTLKEQIDNHESTRMSLVLDRQEREMERRLRDEQNAAYERSLAIDREREKQAKVQALKKEQEEKIRKADEEKAVLERERLEDEQKALKQEKILNEGTWKLWRASQLGPEPSNKNTTEKLARVSIRLLSGERVIRMFSPGQSIDDIYAFVECYGLLKSNTFVPDLGALPPANYVHKYSFDLASTLPRKILAPNANLKIIDEKSVWPSASLVVEVEEILDEE